MDLIEVLMDGRELREPRYFAPQPLDFVVEGEGSLMLFLSGWWTADWSIGNGVEVYENASLEERGMNWAIVGAMEPELQPLIATPSDQNMADALARARRMIDFRREDYLAALHEASGGNDGFDFAPWIGAVLSRPKLDPVEEYKKNHLAPRKMGRIFLSSGDNEVADVLVLDDLGVAATARGNPWLESIAERWAMMDERPDLEAFLNWVADQRSYGPFGLSEPRIFVAEGDVEEIAQRQLAE